MDNFDMNRQNSELPKELTEILMRNNPLKGEVEERPARRRTSEERAERRLAERQAQAERETKEEKHSSNPMLEAIRMRAMKENASAKEHSSYDEMPAEETKMIDVEQIKKAREEMFAEEETEVYRPDYIEEVKSEIPIIEEERKPERKKSPHFNNITFDENEDDQVQVVRHKSRNKINTVPRPAEKGEKLKSDSMFFNYAAQETFEDIVEKAEFTERPKQPKAETRKTVEYTEVKNYKKEERGEALDDFFRDNAFDKYDDDEKSGFIKYFAIAGVLLVALFIFFAVRSFSLSAKLSEANEQIAVYEELQKENEELKMSTLALTEELENMKTAQAEAKAEAETEEPAEETPAQTDTSASSGTSSSTNTYTVVAGDTFGSISTKVYGNFSGYKKIMEANGITNEGSLQIGQKLIIP